MRFVFSVWSLLFAFNVFSEIRSIDYICEAFSEVDPESVVLFDIDETLIETPGMLGGKAWRRYARNVLGVARPKKEAAEIHDYLTYFISQQTPYVAVEEEACRYWGELQQRSIPVFGFTARGKYHWYDTPLPDGEELAVAHLKQAGFKKCEHDTLLDNALRLHPHYGQGIFFAYPIEDKGDLILSIFGQKQFSPSKVIFVDDKMDNIRSVDRAFEQLEIPAICFCYRHIDRFRSFDPVIANIQLEKLFLENRVLSDEEAMQSRLEYAGKDPDAHFLELISLIR